jgi:hypothetical protein
MLPPKNTAEYWLLLAFAFGAIFLTLMLVVGWVDELPSRETLALEIAVFALALVVVGMFERHADRVARAESQERMEAMLERIAVAVEKSAADGAGQLDANA